jgi:hypothetical protein
MKHSECDQYTPKETQQRFEKLVRSALNTKPKPLKSMGPKGVPSQSKKRRRKSKNFNVPKKIAGMALFLGLTGIGYLNVADSSAFAQDAIQSEFIKMRDAYFDCVKKSANSFLLTSSDKSMAVEQGFLACATEEQAIEIWLKSKHIEPIQMEPMIVTMKLAIKKTIIGSSR